jgi:hypothetical protein
MTLHRVFDAAYPPPSAPPGAEGVLGYVGRPGYTPHVWTPEEWRRFQHLRQFPCWLPSLNDAPEHDALLAVDKVRELGWAPRMPQIRVIICDLETSVVPGWFQRWAGTVGGQGFYGADYGSLSTVTADAAVDVWAADWDGLAQLPAGQTMHGNQYRANIAFGGTTIDLSVVDDSMFDRGGVGPRHG